MRPYPPKSRFLLVCLAVALAASPAVAQRIHDDDVRKMIIEDSLALFRGDCPCPYSYAWNGQQCANDSAYMKREPGAPLCYPQDVSPHMIQEYRRQRGL